MECANPHCRKAAETMDCGTLKFLELEVSPEERTIRSDYGFPVCSAQGRFFWLCGRCSLVFNLRRWTQAGLVFEERANAGQPQVWSTSARLPVRSAQSGQQSQKIFPKAAAYLRS